MGDRDREEGGGERERQTDRSDRDGGGGDRQIDRQTERQE